MKPLVTLALVGALLAPAVARATTDTCVGFADGTECDPPCATGGRCRHEKCVGATLLPDGTACASGNRCTVGDTCMAGVCEPGEVQACPDRPCMVGTCDPFDGCIYTFVCDAGTSSSDALPSSQRDALPSSQGDAFPVTTDLRESSSDALPSSSDAGSHPGDDGATTTSEPDPALELHVHGSGLACSTGGGGSSPWAMVLLALPMIAIVWRRSRSHAAKVRVRS